MAEARRRAFPLDDHRDLGHATQAMPLRIEDYALIGDNHTAALVGRDGSIDWLCVPRFDSGACFAALLGDERHGRWVIGPVGAVQSRRRYRSGTLVLETDFETEHGTVRLVDCMLPRDRYPHVVRLVQGLRGRVSMRMEMVIRFDYGSIVPWVRRLSDGTLTAIAGPDALCLRTPVDLRGKNLTTVAEFAVGEGERIPFTLSWHPSTHAAPEAIDPGRAVEETIGWWRKWSERATYDGGWRDAVLRSLITLKALAYGPTGGIVASPTTSLPEQLGGVRNWDYRYCWLRDATFTLYALMLAGYVEEARAWRDWLLRTIAGDPSKLQILYGLSGERRIPEIELGWLGGYEGAAPVRIGNAAAEQFQLDVYGEVLDALHIARRTGLEPEEEAWKLERALVEFVESVWREPDDGLWEVRGPRRHFTHSKVMAWVAIDRAVKAVERFKLDGPAEHWRKLRATIHDDVCRHAYNPAIGAFVQSYGATVLDASVLMIPLVGFLPCSDERVQKTVAAIERDLVVDGLVLRYHPEHSQSVDGLPPGEGTFLPCSFWLADNLALLGRMDDAHRLFERLLSLRNDVGLLSEEFDPRVGRLVGNFPQAFSHVALINTARNLSRGGGPAEHRQGS